MQLLLRQCLLLLSTLLLTFTSFSQEEGSSVKPQEDSLEVIQPTQELADLKMLTPPEGFEISEAFNGYLSLQTSSGIIMTLIRNAVYPRIAEGMNEAFYEKNQLTYISDSSIVTDYGYKGHIYKLSFVQKETKFIRYMAYIGDLKDTLWLNVSYPEMMDALLEEDILKSFKSVNLKPE